MTYRSKDMSSRDEYTQSKARFSQQSKNETKSEKGEGCPVVEGSGSVCGETISLSIINEFRKFYDDFINKLENSSQGRDILKKLTPLRNLVNDMWDQNKMLVETVEELEQEAAAKVLSLQDKLNKSCQKELHCILKAKEREVENMAKELSEKDELLKKYCCQIEELKREMRNKNNKYREILKQLKCGTQKTSLALFAQIENETNDSDNVELEELLLTFLKSLEDERNSLFNQFQTAEAQLKALASEKNIYLMEKSEITNQLQCLGIENEKLLRETMEHKVKNLEKEDLVKNLEQLKSEKKELMSKVSSLQENIKELDNNFKETRWALTSEVAEKHDQVQELKRCVALLEEQLRQADMQTHFKDDIIKELRKDLKSTRKTGRRGLYDIVNEVRGRQTLKNEAVIECDSAISGMSSVGKCTDNNYHSAVSIVDEKDKNEEESPRLQAQVECLKKNLKFRVEQLRDQEELARELEEELSTTKMELAVLQERCDRHERRYKSLGVSSVSEPEMTRHYSALFSAIDKMEGTLMRLSSQHNCGVSNCKAILDQELGNIRSLKKDLKALEMGKVKSGQNKSQPNKGPFGSRSLKFESQSEKCNLIHFDDIDVFREKAVIGAAALEQMKEQIDILEQFLRKHVQELPCEPQVRVTEEKLGKLHVEFEGISDDLCSLLQKFSEFCEAKNLEGLDDYSPVKYQGETICTQTNFPLSDVFICHCREQNMCGQKEKFEFSAGQLDDELCEKRCQLAQYNQELSGRFCEIANLRDVIKKVGGRLKQLHFRGEEYDAELNCTTESHAPTLNNLFCDLQELWYILEKSTDFLYDIPRKLKEDNDKLKENLNCLEKCVCNKEETLRVLQDTVKLRECQIEELKFKMQTSESQSSKLAQDVEEKCRLIANLQEAVRKCKQFEEDLRLEQVESLEFEACGLNEKLKKSEKEILLRDRKIESLHNEITVLSSKNFILSQELKIMEPRLKSLYKTSHLFEKMVNDLQSELNSKENEVDCLHEKIKFLEDESEAEFKKCEERALEDSKCIEELSFTLKRFQNEVCCTQEKCMAMAEEEKKYRKERESSEVKENELKTTITQLRTEVSSLQQELQSQVRFSTPEDPEKINIEGRFPIVHIAPEDDPSQQPYEAKIEELERHLDCAHLERQEERKCMLEKLCNEKKENIKCKALITKLNENIRRRINNEKNLKDYVDQFAVDNENLKAENQLLKTEVAARKKIMSEIEKQEGFNMSDIEELICHLKIQKAEFKSRCSFLKAEVDKEVKLKQMLECRVEDLNFMLEQRLQELNEMADNYKNTSSHIKETLTEMKNVEENLLCLENEVRKSVQMSTDDCERLKRSLEIKSAENAKLICQVQILRVDMEALQAEFTVDQAEKDAFLSQLQHEVNCLESELQGMATKSRRLLEENEKLQAELENWGEKEDSLQGELRQKHEKVCEELKKTTCEKNKLLRSIDELQKQLEQICLDNVNKEKMTRELMEECSRRKNQTELYDAQLRNKSDKIINNLSNEVKNLQRELFEVRENYKYVNNEYQDLLERFKSCEKKKSSLEKLYVDVNNDNKYLQELRLQFERDLCELKTQNGLLREKISNMGENYRSPDDTKKFFEKIKEMTAMIKTLEQRVIPNLEQEIAEKNCCIENLKIELREANISSQRIRNEALRVIQHTKKYLAAQRCANESLKSRLECSNKRGNILGAENRDLEEQLKAVTRMNEFLLSQLEGNKTEFSDNEPRSFSPLPWGCPNVERDTSSSEYLAESGFQSMQPSPTNMEYAHENQKRPCIQWNGAKRSKHGGSVEYPAGRNGFSFN